MRWVWPTIARTRTLEWSDLRSLLTPLTLRSPIYQTLTWSNPQSSLLKRTSLPQHSMKHAMELTMQWTEILNPGQTCVLGADQTLYAIVKLIQWQFPGTLGEDKLVVITAHGIDLRPSDWTAYETFALQNFPSWILHAPQDCVVQAGPYGPGRWTSRRVCRMIVHIVGRLLLKGTAYSESWATPALLS